MFLIRYKCINSYLCAVKSYALRTSRPTKLSAHITTTLDIILCTGSVFISRSPFLKNYTLPKTSEENVFFEALIPQPFHVTTIANQLKFSLRRNFKRLSTFSKLYIVYKNMLQRGISIILFYYSSAVAQYKRGNLEGRGHSLPIIG